MARYNVFLSVNAKMKASKAKDIDATPISTKTQDELKHRRELDSQNPTSTHIIQTHIRMMIDYSRHFAHYSTALGFATSRPNLDKPCSGFPVKEIPGATTISYVSQESHL
jgi:hypothetical protein